MKSIELYLGEQVTVVMDRPLGSKHPTHGFIYPINYGYIPGTVAGDGEEVDAYIIGEFEPLERFEGHIVAIIRRNDDVEEKMVVCKQRDRYTLEQIKALVEFQERYFDSKIIMA